MPIVRVRMHTEVRSDGVVYEIFQDDTIVWSRYPKFGQELHHRAGGTLFVETAREQERFMYELTEKLRKENE